MTGAYRRPGALDLVPPEAGSPWWEELAYALVLRAQPSEATATRRARATAPPTDVLAVIDMVLRKVKPRCRRCGKDVQSAIARRSSHAPHIMLLIECHGERFAKFIETRVIEVALSGPHEAAARYFMAELSAPVFEPPPPAPPPADGHECFGYCPLCDPRAHLGIGCHPED